jgi:branched-chain amino acid transport system ATP-binding protein
MSATPLLEINNVVKRFGGLSALDGVNLALAPRKLHAIIGPNGAGKTTLFNVISGTLPTTSGQIRFLGEDITGEPVHRINKRGLSRTLQIKSVFSNLTVRENLWIAAQSRLGVFAPFSNWRKCRHANDRTDSVLQELGLGEIADQKAANLSYGDLALLEIGIAVATDPKLILLDEPICGMGPAETEQTVAKIRELAERIEIVIIEHDIEVVFNIADEITVMTNGKVLARGTPDEISKHPDVRVAYLGDDDDA